MTIETRIICDRCRVSREFTLTDEAARSRGGGYPDGFAYSKQQFPDDPTIPLLCRACKAEEDEMLRSDSVARRRRFDEWMLRGTAKP